MKKLICILLAIAMCAFAGCSNDETRETEPQETEPEIESGTDPSYWETFFDDVPKLPGGTKLY